MDMRASFLTDLFDAGLLIETGVDGLYGHGGQFEDVIEAFCRLIDRVSQNDGAEAVHFPPGMSRRLFEASGYMKSFPHLAGTVHAFCGTDLDHMNLLQCLEVGSEAWTQSQKPTEIVLTPAACYPLYPTVARRGPLPRNGSLFNLNSYCFRHEISKDPARQQLFRMREYVCMGTEEQVTEFRQLWINRSIEIMASVGLDAKIEVANDPFFGRIKSMYMENQRNRKLKYELVIPIASIEQPTACMSFNYHQDSFGIRWELRLQDGSIAHTACVAFGLERIVLALFHAHGLEYKRWPSPIQETLWP